jgi:predicted transcriptional regulator of viral defense system
MTSNLTEFLENPTDSSRHKARVLVNMQVKSLTGGAVCLVDLADTFNLCAGLDELQEAIENADEFTPMQDLQDIAQEIAAQLLEEEGFPI